MTQNKFGLNTSMDLLNKFRVDQSFLECLKSYQVLRNYILHFNEHSKVLNLIDM